MTTPTPGKITRRVRRTPRPKVVIPPSAVYVPAKAKPPRRKKKATER